MARTCANCGLGQPDEAQYCSSCGEPAPGVAPREGDYPGSPPPKRMSTGLILLIVFGCLLLCGIPVVAIIAAIAIPNLLAAKLSANETAAIATLRNLASCQAQMQTCGKIDCDNDGIGEYGTFLELTGSAGGRKGFAPAGGPNLVATDFSAQGSLVSPPILSPSMAIVDANGVVQKSGYCFLIWLPDSEKRGAWTHETGPGPTPGLAGGNAHVGVDASEQHWCAYAWPAVRGTSGNRCFFVNEKGDVFQSRNAVAKHQGPTGIPAADSVFGPGKDGPRFGAPATDGDVWNITN